MRATIGVAKSHGAAYFRGKVGRPSAVGLISLSGTGGFDSTLQHALARPEAICGSLTAAGASVSMVDDKVCVVGGRTSAFQAGGAWESGR